MHSVPRYSLVIEWSPQDQAYVVSLPEWEEHGVRAHTRGVTRQEAARAGETLLALLIERQLARGLPLPEPHVYAHT